MPAKRPSQFNINKPAITAIASLVAALAVAPLSSYAVGLGDLDVRSYLGEPLNLRIGVLTQPDEELDSSCFAVISPASGEPAIVRRDVRVTLSDVRGKRFLDLRGTGPYNEPIARLSVRASCKGEAGVVRDYAILLDPAPILAATSGPIVVDTSARQVPQTAAPVEALRADTRAADAAGATSGAIGRWTVFAGDTLNSIAKGIHPNSRSRRAQYIAALRELNPELAGIANDTALFPNSQLVLPDLKALSGAAPRISGQIDSASAEPRRSARREAADVDSPVQAPGKTSQRAAVKTAPRDLPQASEGRPTRSTRASTEKAIAKNEGFSLRLSGGDIDISRSQGVTEEVRAQLRERQLLLDSDDQVAQMLALKNSVKVIEKRLNELQLKLSGMPGMLSPAEVAAVKATTAETAKATEPPPSATATQPPPVPVAATPAIETPAPVAAKPVAKPAPPVKVTPPDSDFLAGIPLTWLLGGIGLLAAMLAWIFVRRKSVSNTVNVGGTRINVPVPTARDEFNKWADEPDTQWLEQNQPGGKAAAQTVAPATATASTKYVPKTERTTKAPNAEADGVRSAAMLTGAQRSDAPAKAVAATATAAEAMNILMPQAPVKSEVAPKLDVNTPLDLSLDEIDLPLFDDGGQKIVEIPELREGQTPEDRLQRLRYMEERLPELAAKTVSVDEPDTVVNAARSYFEEDQQARACELLIFATEERPQELRYWLALFEIYRVEKLARPYSELASKFQSLFGQTHIWNKVRHVGHELDPGNTLFAAGRNATESEQFDPHAENWLNAPNAGIASALVQDLRKTLFEEHEVGVKDFMSVTQRIAVIQ